MQRTTIPTEEVLEEIRKIHNRMLGMFDYIHEIIDEMIQEKRKLRKT